MKPIIAKYEKLLKPFADRMLSEGKSEKTVNQYCFYVQDMLKYLDKKHGTVTLDNLTFDMLDGYRLYLRTTRGLKNISMESYIVGIRNWLKFHDNNLWIDFIPPKREEEGEPDFLKPIEVIKLISAVDKEQCGERVKRRKRMMIAVLFSTGLRINACSQLKMTDINRDSLVINVRAETTKNRKGRPVPLSKTALKYIDEYKEIRPESTYLFDKNVTEHMSANALYQDVKKTASMIGMRERVHPHLFRASFLTAIDDGNLSVKELVDVSGTSFARLSRYLGKKRQVSENIGRHHPLDEENERTESV